MNLSRKIWHMSGVIIPVFLYFVYFSEYCLNTRLTLIIILSFFLIFNILIDLIRLNHVKSGEIIWKYLGFLMKSGEKNRINGIIPYMVSNIFVLLFIQEEIAIISILFLVLSDPFAAFSGYLFGKKEIYNGRTLEGTIGFIITGFVSALFIYLFNDKEYFIYSGFFVFFITVTSGVAIAAITELYAQTKLNGFVDDNLLIPIVSSLTMVFINGIFSGNWNTLLIIPMKLIFC